MIYVRLYGGMGNQLFQYATARAVSLRASVPLGLDCRYLDGRPTHLVFALDHFAVDAEVNPPCLPPFAKTQRLRYGLWRAGLLGRPSFLREQGLGFNQRVLMAGDETYLHGYFQTEKYFLDQEHQLREELRVSARLRGENKSWARRITDDHRSVSVHLRRGDYLHGARGEGTHGICDKGYYRRALLEIAERTGTEPRAYVFSDDPQWARDNLSLGLETFVIGHNGVHEAHEDLRLMSLCRHHVIANSTFSWWGAWLDGSPNSLTVAPKKWFASDRLVNADIIPPRWLRL